MLSSIEVVPSPARSDLSGGRKRHTAIDAVRLGMHIRARVEARKLASGISTIAVAARVGTGSAQGREVRLENASAACESASETSFTGKEEDVQVGLVYFGKRFLSPYLNRWVSPDPLAVHDIGRADLDLYAYVKGQALKATDPLGLCGPDDGSGGCTSTGGGGGSEGASGTTPNGGEPGARAPGSYTPPSIMPVTGQGQAEKEMAAPEPAAVSARQRAGSATPQPAAVDESWREQPQFQGLHLLTGGDPGMRGPLMRRELFTDSMGAVAAGSVAAGVVAAPEISLAAPALSISTPALLRTGGGALAGGIGAAVRGGGPTDVARGMVIGGVVSAVNPFGSIPVSAIRGGLSAGSSNALNQLAQSAVNGDKRDVNWGAVGISMAVGTLFGAWTAGATSSSVRDTLILSSARGLTSGLVGGAMQGVHF